MLDFEIPQNFTLFRFMLHNSQMKADKKKGVGTDCPYPILRLLALPFIADKNNSPHQRICQKPIRLYIPIVWCHCHHLYYELKLCENLRIKDNSITPVISKLFKSQAQERHKNN